MLLFHFSYLQQRSTLCHSVVCAWKALGIILSVTSWLRLLKIWKQAKLLTSTIVTPRRLILGGKSGGDRKGHFPMHSPVVSGCATMIFIMLPGNFIGYFPDSIWKSVAHIRLVWQFTLWSEVIQLFSMDHIISLECLSVLCFGDDWTFLTVWVLMMDTDLCTEVREAGKNNWLGCSRKDCSDRGSRAMDTNILW